MTQFLTVVLAIGLAGFLSETAIAIEQNPSAGWVTTNGYVDVAGGIVEIASPRDGIVQEVRVDEGASVKRDDLLLIVDNLAAKAQVEVAIGELGQAENVVGLTKVRMAAADREVRRLAPLISTNIATRQSFDRANDEVKTARALLATQEAAILTAKAKLAAAQVEVDRRMIRAPFDGTIVRRFAQPGDGISTLNVTTLFWLAPLGPQIVRAELEEPNASRVAVGQAAEVTIAGDDSLHLRGRVQKVSQVFGLRRVSVYDTTREPKGRVLESIIAIDDQPSRQLVLGQRVIVRIDVGANGRQ